jgi:hypothetical protein
MRRSRAWTMPAEEARALLQLLEEKIASSNIQVEHRDVLIRLRSNIEEDLLDGTEPSSDAASELGHTNRNAA